MPGQHAPNVQNRFDECGTELLHSKVRSHPLDNALPELFAAFFMSALVANHREFMRAGRDENQHRVALARLVHTEPPKLLVRRKKGITLQLPALDQNANLTGSFRFCLANRLDDPVVLESGEEFSRSHFVSPTRSRAASAKTAPSTTEPAESATTTATGRPAAATRDKNGATSSR
jgi:hypothetical protein